MAVDDLHHDGRRGGGVVLQAADDADIGARVHNSVGDQFADEQNRVVDEIIRDRLGDGRRLPPSAGSAFHPWSDARTNFRARAGASWFAARLFRDTESVACGGDGLTAPPEMFRYGENTHEKKYFGDLYTMTCVTK